MKKFELFEDDGFGTRKDEIATVAVLPVSCFNQPINHEAKVGGRSQVPSFRSI